VLARAKQLHSISSRAVSKGSPLKFAGDPARISQVLTQPGKDFRDKSDRIPSTHSTVVTRRSWRRGVTSLRSTIAIPTHRRKWCRRCSSSSSRHHHHNNSTHTRARSPWQAPTSRREKSVKGYPADSARRASNPHPSHIRRDPMANRSSRTSSRLHTRVPHLQAHPPVPGSVRASRRLTKLTSRINNSSSRRRLYRGDRLITTMAILATFIDEGGGARGLRLCHSSATDREYLKHVGSRKG
jgi:hypothetical protein